MKPQELDFDKKWGKLKDTITRVLRMGSVKHEEWVECFSEVYALCVAFPESLADRLYDEVRQLLKDNVANLYNKVSKYL